MKKTNYILTLFIFCMALLSCSKDSADDNPNTYGATMEQNFKDPLKNSENIQVEDYVLYTLTITDSKDDQNVEYRLISVRESQYYHQTIWKDFGFYLKDNDPLPFDVEQKHISFYKKGTHTFYIRPFVPGTFKHTYYLQKLINGKEVGDKIKLTNEFNAVKINVMEGERWHSPADVATPYYFVYIDDGREQTDNYLNIPQGGTLSCEITIDGETYVHRTRYNNEEFYIRDVGGTPRLGNISLVKLILRTKDLPDFMVEYHNVKHNFNKGD